jgi:hypothetical protein
MLIGEPLTVDDLTYPIDGTALDRMAPPTLDDWTVAIETLRVRSRATGPPVSRSQLYRPPPAPDWFAQQGIAYQQDAAERAALYQHVARQTVPRQRTALEEIAARDALWAQQTYGDHPPLFVHRAGADGRTTMIADARPPSPSHPPGGDRETLSS